MLKTLEEPLHGQTQSLKSIAQTFGLDDVESQSKILTDQSKIVDERLARLCKIYVHTLVTTMGNGLLSLLYKQVSVKISNLYVIFI